MTKRVERLILTCLVATTLVMTSCGQVVEEKEEKLTPTEEAEAPELRLVNLEGRVLYGCNQKPASGYYVYIFPGSKGLSYCVGVSRVDEKGIYHATLEEGIYQLVANEDQDALGFSYSHAKVEIKEGRMTVADDILLNYCPDLRLISPFDGASLATSRPTFMWQGHREATGYRVSVQSEAGPRYPFPRTPEVTTETTIVALEDLPAGSYEWCILVFHNDSFSSPWESSRWRFTVEAD
jgi:hypothetical protein